MDIEGKFCGLNNMCKIEKYHGQLVLADVMSSDNGTFISGERLTRASRMN
jgi:hypothetical protein